MQPPKPEWLRIRAQRNETSDEVEALMKKLSLHTVCEEANCPNRGECFSRRTATFMILGSVCTRNCTFCNVEKGCAREPDQEEPRHVAEAVRQLHLKHVVVTSVTRDDLPDGGAGHFADVIRHIRALDVDVVIEVLIPDFQGNPEALKKVAAASPHIINHNVETVPRLYPTVRPMAKYQRSLELLQNVKDMDSRILTKSGIMVGLGEEQAEVLQVLKDLREVQCDLLTIGQYLAPSRNHHPVVEYVHPDIFEYYKEAGLKMGFRHIAAGPFVRSSYLADKALENIR